MIWASVIQSPPHPTSTTSATQILFTVCYDIVTVATKNES
jgi:hypothetical protein